MFINLIGNHLHYSILSVNVFLNARGKVLFFKCSEDSTWNQGKLKKTPASPTVEYMLHDIVQTTLNNKSSQNLFVDTNDVNTFTQSINQSLTINNQFSTCDITLYCFLSLSTSFEEDLVTVPNATTRQNLITIRTLFSTLIHGMKRAQLQKSRHTLQSYT